MKTKHPQIDSELLAKFVLAKKGPMNHLKLQKLLYYCEAWHLAIIESSLIPDHFEAWLHGPVCKKVYNYFKNDSVLLDNISIQDNQKRSIIKTVEDVLEEEQVELLEDVLNEYGKRSSYYLECLTHEEEPWQEARKGYSIDSSCNVKISKITMKKYYANKI